MFDMASNQNRDFAFKVGKVVSSSTTFQRFALSGTAPSLMNPCVSDLGVSRGPEATPQNDHLMEEDPKPSPSSAAAEGTGGGGGGGGVGPFIPRLIVSREGIVHIYSPESISSTPDAAPLSPPRSPAAPGNSQQSHGTVTVGPDLRAASEHLRGQTFEQVWADLTQRVTREAATTSVSPLDADPHGGPRIITSRRPRFALFSSPNPTPESLLSLLPTLGSPSSPPSSTWDKALGRDVGSDPPAAVPLLGRDGGDGNIVPGAGLLRSRRTPLFGSETHSLGPGDDGVSSAPSSRELADPPPLDADDGILHASSSKRLMATLRGCRNPQVMIEVIGDHVSSMTAAHFSLALNRYADMAARGSALPKPQVGLVI